MDIASFVGLILTVTSIAIFMVLGGDFRSFFNIQSWLIVTCGTAAATLLSFRFDVIVSALKAVRLVFHSQKSRSDNTVTDMLKLSILCRKEGVFGLDRVEVHSAYMRKMISLLMDAPGVDLFRRIMRLEIEALKAQLNVGQ